MWNKKTHARWLGVSRPPPHHPWHSPTSRASRSDFTGLGGLFSGRFSFSWLQDTTADAAASYKNNKENVFLPSSTSDPPPSLPQHSDAWWAPRPVVSEWFILRQIKFSCARLACNDLSCSEKGQGRGNGTTEQSLWCCRERKMQRERLIEGNQRHFRRKQNNRRLQLWNKVQNKACNSEKLCFRDIAFQQMVGARCLTLENGDDQPHKVKINI